MIKFINKAQKNMNDIQYIFAASTIALLLQVVLQLLVSLCEGYVGGTKTYFMGESKAFIMQKR